MHLSAKKLHNTKKLSYLKRSYVIWRYFTGNKSSNYVTCITCNAAHNTCYFGDVFHLCMVINLKRKLQFEGINFYPRVSYVDKCFVGWNDHFGMKKTWGKASSAVA